MIGGPSPQNQRSQGQNQHGRGNYNGPSPRGHVGQNMERKEFYFFVEGGMHKVSVGPKVKVMDVVIVEEIILQMSIANRTRSLGCLNLWPTHTNRRETI